MATILVTTSTFPRWADDIGSARFVFDLSLQMAQHHQVIVLAPHAPGAAYMKRLMGWMYGVSLIFGLITFRRCVTAAVFCPP